MSRRRVGAVGVAVVLLLVGCGSESGTASDDGSTTSTPAPVRTDLLVPAGEPMVEELVVPEGTALAGIFSTPHELEAAREAGGADEPWAADLVVTGDPFEAWDDLADQLRAVGAPLAGSADSCLWTLQQPEPEGEAVLPPAGEAVGEADAGEDAAQEQRFQDERDRLDELLVDDRPPAGATGVTCSANVVVDRDTVPSGYSALLDADVDGPAVLRVGRTFDAVFFDGLPDSLSRVTTYLVQLQGSAREVRTPTFDRVPPGAADQLPASPAQPAAAVGESFGTAVNCFAGGYQRFVLPRGTALVADGLDSGSSSVLRVDDPAGVADVLVALQRQAEGDGSTPGVSTDASEAKTSDGQTVLQRSVGVDAGGGACTFTSADGTSVLVERHSD